ncbi:MAG TPA: twin-arginine translocation signal domain-containing protein, partial [Vicinamibacterales bacterium]|nr:twin-arginine translocation signal domain-containing protein [Vicinamibacterales bacterium]
MSASRREFIKTVGIGTVALASADAVAELLAQSPRGRVLDSKFKGLSDVALAEARLYGCTYADIRFQMTAGVPGASANFAAAGGRGD